MLSECEVRCSREGSLQDATRQRMKCERWLEGGAERKRSTYCTVCLVVHRKWQPRLLPPVPPSPAGFEEGCTLERAPNAPNARRP